MTTGKFTLAAKILKHSTKDTEEIFRTAEPKLSSKFYVRSSRLENVEHRTIHRRHTEFSILYFSPPHVRASAVNKSLKF
jgi:hypothetical protein